MLTPTILSPKLKDDTEAKDFLKSIKQQKKDLLRQKQEKEKQHFEKTKKMLEVIAKRDEELKM